MTCQSEDSIRRQQLVEAERSEGCSLEQHHRLPQMDANLGSTQRSLPTVVQKNCSSKLLSIFLQKVQYRCQMFCKIMSRLGQETLFPVEFLCQTHGAVLCTAAIVVSNSHELRFPLVLQCSSLLWQGSAVAISAHTPSEMCAQHTAQCRHMGSFKKHSM